MQIDWTMLTNPAVISYGLQKQTKKTHRRI